MHVLRTEGPVDFAGMGLIRLFNPVSACCKVRMGQTVLSNMGR